MSFRTSTKVEQWRPVPGFEHYHISTGGKVKNTRTGVIRKPYQSGSGTYLKIDLCHEGRRLKEYVHRLVMLAFIGEPPPRAHVHHRNAKRDDNRLSNLEYRLPVQNIRESVQRRANRQIIQLELFQEAA